MAPSNSITRHVRMEAIASVATPIRLLVALLLSAVALRYFTGLHHHPSDPITAASAVLNREAAHPLDPVTIHEISAVRSILSSHPAFTAPNPFPTIHSLSLSEPNKPTVLAWRPGDTLPPRRATVVAYVSRHTHLLSVDIASRSVLRHTISPASAGCPRLTTEDKNRSTAAALADPAFTQALRTRGFDPTPAAGDVICAALASGWFGRDEEGRMTTKVQCWALQGSPNFDMRPIEGLVSWRWTTSTPDV